MGKRRRGWWCGVEETYSCILHQGQNQGRPRTFSSSSSLTSPHKLGFDPFLPLQGSGPLIPLHFVYLHGGLASMTKCPFNHPWRSVVYLGLEVPVQHPFVMDVPRSGTHLGKPPQDLDRGRTGRGGITVLLFQF